jgi:polynucleotide 5'-kinase involved in rRNA processing
MFRNQEEDDEPVTDQVAKSKTANDNSYMQFDDGLRLKIKNVGEHEKQLFAQNDELKSIVFVNTTQRNLNKIAMSVVTDSCIVIDGPLSSGKTTLVEYLANKTNSKLIKYQMDEFMDSKVSFNQLLNRINFRRIT